MAIDPVPSPDVAQASGGEQTQEDGQPPLRLEVLDRATLARLTSRLSRQWGRCPDTLARISEREPAAGVACAVTDYKHPTTMACQCFPHLR